MAQAAQGGGGVFILGHTPKPPGHGPGKPALGGPALSRGLAGGLLRTLPASATV